MPFGRQPAVRPPARPFNAEEARQLALAVTRSTGPDGDTCLQMGSHRFFNGYVEKAVAFRVRGGDAGRVSNTAERNASKVDGS